MTTVDLYKKHKNGDISREKFLYEVRRDTRLPFITNLTSYSDAVQILKNKSIIKEDAYPEEDPFNQGKAANNDNQNYDKNPYEKGTKEHDLWWDGWVDAETLKQIEHDRYMDRWERGIDEEELSELSPELKARAAMSAYDKASNAYYYSKDGNLQNDPLEKQKRLSQASTFAHTLDPKTLDKVQSMIGSNDSVKITKGRGVVFLYVTDKQSKETTEFEIEKDRYKVKKGMVSPEVGRKVQRVISYLQQQELAETFNKGVQESGNEDYNPEGAWQEGYDAFMAGHHQEENPYEGDTSEHKNWDMGYEKAQHDGPGVNESLNEGKELTKDTVNPYEFQKGLSWELGYFMKPAPDWDDSSLSNADLEKATKKVLKNLSNNAIYYTELIANKGQKAKKEKEVKVEEDGMAKMKGVEKVSANVQTSLGKKEKGKLRPEGVKEMKGSKKAFSKIKLMKENEEPVMDKKEAFKNKLKEMLKLEISDTLKQQISQEKKKLGQLYQKAGQQMANPTTGGTGNDPFGM